MLSHQAQVYAMQVGTLQTDLFLSIMPAALQIELSTYQRSEHHSKQA